MNRTRVWYQLFLTGEYYSGKFTKEGFDKNSDYLNQAIAKNPNYAQAHNRGLVAAKSADLFKTMGWAFLDKVDYFRVVRYSEQ